MESVLLNSYFQNYFDISSSELEIVSSLFKKETLGKGEFFTNEGSFCKKLSFIKSGHIRIFKYSDGKDVTQWICSEGELVTDLASLLFELPSRWNIEAIDDCELFTITAKDYHGLGEKLQHWKDVEKLFLAKCFLTLEDRVFSFLSMTAQERFEHLHNYKPQLFNQVPLIYLASMLGMTPETLSRIRKKSIS